MHKLSRQKVALARLFTDFGYDILLSDVDVVWLKDPVSYFSGYRSLLHSRIPKIESESSPD